MARVLLMVGLLLMLLGAVDPLEGSLLILPGSGLVALAAVLGKTRYRKPLLISFALILVGVGTMFGFSAVGGMGGDTQRSMWWALTILPYPAGWLMGLFYGIRFWRSGGRVSGPE